MTDSSTGGFLLPAPASTPVEGLTLNQFIQQFIVAVTGLSGDLVRVAFQPEPGNVPDAGDAWASFRWETLDTDTGPAFTGQEFQEHETITVKTSFYDLGTNGLADHYSALLRDGLKIPQNAEYWTAAGMGLAHIGSRIAVPQLVKMRWQYQIDLDFSLRRPVVRTYAILNVNSLSVGVSTS